MAKRSFGRVLDGIVSVVLASAVGAVGAYGCGGTTSAGESGVGESGVGEGGTPGDVGPRGPGFEDEASFSCPALANITSNLKPAVAVDYVELRRQTVSRQSSPGPLDAGDADGGDAGPPPVVLKNTSSTGVACAGAQNPDACRTALAGAIVASPQTNTSGGWAIEPGSNFQPSTYDVEYLVYTRGDEVGTVKSTEELVRFFGPIDTLEEVRLLLASRVRSFTCTTTPRKSGWKQNADGSWEVLVVGATCGGLIPYRVRVRVGADGAMSDLATDDLGNQAVCGRRPVGLHEKDGGGSEKGLGPYFAEVAYLEAASVIAFRRLELELIRNGAPTELVQRARRSRADEIRHARDTAALARRFGAEVSALDVAPMTERDLLAIAIENATEGCVRETYGALVAAFQARAAQDPEIARVLTGIARDEARHAELSHDVAVWLDTRLDAHSRERVASERARALAELRESIERAPASDVVHVAGMPTVREARALLAGLERDVLAA